jgi:LPS sulfotransferase NodH
MSAKVNYDELSPNFENPGKASRFYVIASNPRSGSSLFGRALAETGKAGAPHEYLKPDLMAKLFEKWGCNDINQYFDKLKSINTSPNGVFGIKMHFFQLAEAIDRHGFDIHRTLPGATYIRIKRGDIIRQAISLSRASQTGQWSSAEKHRRAAVYSAFHIHRCWSDLVSWEQQWNAYFQESGLMPHTIFYEQLTGHYRPTIKSALTDIIGADSAGIPIVSPKMAMQRDALTEEWYERFLADVRPEGTRRRTKYRLAKWMSKRGKRGRA